MAKVIKNNNGTYEINGNIFNNAMEALAYMNKLDKMSSLKDLSQKEKAAQKAKNLRKGLEDWGNVYSDNNNRWYQKAVEEKKAIGEKELEKMEAALTNSLNKRNTSNVQLDSLVPKKNKTRKIFILNEE